MKISQFGHKCFEVTMQITEQMVKNHGLTIREYQTVLEILGREPTFTELGIFSVMWSEHCSYKSSRTYLKDFPTHGEKVIQGPGENAGAVDIGNGLAAVFKMESHNHPSYIEPYQGAATGVGGILRDIFTMGARPIASMNSLHFGPLDKKKNKYLLSGVVAGIAGYGNCIGIPTVGGEVVFDECYNGNPIINVFSLGIVDANSIFLGKASGIGNSVIYAGSKTGRDGIHGATMASEEFDETSDERRPTVQVGDPFTEKCVLEACLELMKTDAIVAIQDMGAAGLTCSTVEMSSRGGVGMEIDLDKVPQRESMMSCYEIMLSESQERMLIVTKPGKENTVVDIFKKWGLEASVIGKVIKEDLLIVRQNNEIMAEIPASALTDKAPVYNRPKKIPLRFKKSIDKKQKIIINDTENFTEDFVTFICHPVLASRRWIFEQYDHMVRTNTILRPGADAAVIRIKGTKKALAMTVDSNPLQCYLDPYQGGINVVCEAARNLSAVGATPLAITDCLNFGNPETPDVMWEFARVVKGITNVCTTMKIPIVSGNVSFYNETLGKPIFPTPTIGMIGLIEDAAKIATPWFKQNGDIIFLLGSLKSHLGASLYLSTMKNRKEGPVPKRILSRELRYQSLVRELINENIISSAHDCSDGGLATALAECCFHPTSPLGANITLKKPENQSWEETLFGETQSRFIISCKPTKRDELMKKLNKIKAFKTELGVVTEKTFSIGTPSKKEPLIHIALSELIDKWETGLDNAML